MSQFLTQLKDNVLVADGAIGTILYSEGLDTCPEAFKPILMVQILKS